MAGLLSGVDPASNLVLKAAELLKQKTGMPGGCHITLEKHLPAGAGLGGGSSDAAATLLALNELWKCGLSGTELSAIGMALGADVPVCLQRQSCFVEGVGETVAPFPLPPMDAVLLYPNEPLATKDVFAACRARPRMPLPALPPVADTRALISWLATLHNDLEPAAMRLKSVIGEMLAFLLSQEGCLLARMSGSGSCCVGVFSSTEAAQGAARHIAEKKPAWWIKPTRLAL
jgi:4-diphosphocytidyl-2-C-methyl-D-erythritol kinase